jgi:hypothetical protein
MTLLTRQGRPGARRLRAMMTVSLLVLAPIPGSAGSPTSPEEDASLRKEWERVRANQERTITDNQKRLDEIYGGAVRPDGNTRAERITRDRATAAAAYLKDAGRGRILAQTAETAGRDSGALAALYSVQYEYLDRATGEWDSGPERKGLQTAIGLLQKNLERTAAHLKRATEAAEGLSAQLGSSGVLDKVTRIEAAAKEAGGRLSARWERERAARERERQQREREAGERAREQRQ